MSEPRLRFKQDNGNSYPPLQEVTFGTVIKPFTEKTKTEDEDILLSCAIEGVFLNSELFRHQRGASNKGYKKIRRNTLILSAQNLHLGNANVNQRFDHGIISPAYNTFEIIGCNPDYMAHWLKRSATKKFFYDATTTGASQCRRNVDWNALYEQTLYLPCEEEQQKIADFLSVIDETIVASENEVQNLATQKKIMVKKILSREVRFKRFDGSEFPEWQNRPFWDAVSLNSSLVDPTKEPYCSMRHVGTANIEKNTGNLLPCMTAAEEGITSGKYLFDEDCVVYSKIRPELSKATIPGFVGLCSADAYPLKPKEGILPETILMQLLSRKFVKFATSTSARTKMPKINQEELGEYIFVIPCLEEQRLIADFLSDFDEAITAAKRELELWRELKKGLLQQMFV